MKSTSELDTPSKYSLEKDSIKVLLILLMLASLLVRNYSDFNSPLGRTFVDLLTTIPATILLVNWFIDKMSKALKLEIPVIQYNNRSLMHTVFCIVDDKKAPNAKNFVTCDREKYGSYYNYVMSERLPLVAVEIIGETTVPDAIELSSSGGIAHQLIVRYIDSGRIKCVIPHHLIKQTDSIISS